jgi:hypothetical protein
VKVPDDSERTAPGHGGEVTGVAMAEQPQRASIA